MKKFDVWQKTVFRSGSLSGIGLHTGEPCSLKVSPGLKSSGLVFFKNGVKLGSLSKNEVPIAEAARCTILGEPPDQILTTEHFLAAVWCLGITNLRVDVEGPEIPGLDGSAVGFVRFLKELGLKKQNSKKPVWRLKDPIFCHDSGKAIHAFPVEEDVLSVAYVLDYDHPALKNKVVDFDVDPVTFEKEIAPARTFCTQEEARSLKKLGFGRGADFTNTLVMSKHGPVRNRLRFKEECARHKALDLLGDLSLLGFGLSARIVGIRSGHTLNRKLVEEIRRQKGDE